MYHLVHVEINISSFSGNGTDVCRNASLQSEVPKLAKKKNQKAHSVQWQRFEKQYFSFTQQSTNLRI